MGTSSQQSSGAASLGASRPRAWPYLARRGKAHCACVLRQAAAAYVTWLPPLYLLSLPLAAPLYLLRLYLLWLYSLWLHLLWLLLHLPGSLALPSLVKLASVLGGKLQATWHSGDQLPVEIELPAELRFHSVLLSCHL